MSIICDIFIECHSISRRCLCTCLLYTSIVYELIESQVDATIPMPRVEAIHPEDEELACRLEDFLRSEAKRLDFTQLNDLQERTVPIQGLSLIHI